MENETPIEAASAGLVWNRRILLVRRGREPAKGLFAFPGGRILPGETAEDAARRELLEETGIVAGSLSHFRTIEPDSAGPVAMVGFRLHVFAGLHEGGEPVAGDDAEHAGWYTLSEMSRLPVTDSSLEIARLLLGGRTGTATLPAMRNGT